MMDPILIAALTMGASAVCGGAGFALGRRKSVDAGVEVSPTPAPSVDRRREKLLLDELQALRTLFGLKAVSMQSGDLLSQSLDVLVDQAQELIAQKQTVACAIFNDEGLVVWGDEQLKQNRVMGSIISRCQMIGALYESDYTVEVSTEYGETITLFGVPKQSLHLAVWTKGLPLSEQVLARTLYTLHGASSLPKPMKSKRLQVVRGEHALLDEVINDLLDEVPAASVGVWSGRDVLLSSDDVRVLDARHVPLMVEVLDQALTLHQFGNLEHIRIHEHAHRWVIGVTQSAQNRVVLALAFDTQSSLPRRQFDRALGRLSRQISKVDTTADVVSESPESQISIR